MIFFKNYLIFSRNNICCFLLLLLGLTSSAVAMEEEEIPLSTSRSNRESLRLMDVMRNAAFRSVIQYQNEHKPAENGKDLLRALRVQPYTLENEEGAVETLDFPPSKNQGDFYHPNGLFPNRLFKDREASLSRDEFLEIIEQDEFTIPRFRNEADFFYTGLSIDGGGMRGLIPATILTELEEFAGNKKIYQLFDYIGGTSIGGILALGCVATADGHSPHLEVKKLQGLFYDHGSDIFCAPRGVRKVYNKLAQLWTVQYSAAPLEKLLDLYFNNLKLSNTLAPVLVTAAKVPEGESHTFESVKAQRNNTNDYLMRHVARATSAAPTYFPGISFTDLAGEREHTFVDGGIWINNPSELVYKRIIKLFEDNPQKADHNNVLMISLGTGICPLSNSLPKTAGLIKAAPAVIEGMMSANSHGVDTEMRNLLEQNYIRIQPHLDQYIDLADTRPEALTALSTAAHTLDHSIEELARHLAENANRKHPASL